MPAGQDQTWSIGRTTATAATAFLVASPIRRELRAKVEKVVYEIGTTLHTLTCFRALAWTTLVLAVVASGTSYKLSRDPGNYSANATLDGKATPSTANNLVTTSDLLGIVQPDGKLFVATVSGTTTVNADGTCTTPATAAPTGGFTAGARVFFFGVAADVNPRNGLAHPSLNIQAAASATAYITKDCTNGEVFSALGLNEPILIHSNNATAQGWIDYISGSFGP